MLSRRCSIEAAKHIINFFHRRLATPFYFFAKRYGNIPTVTAYGSVNAVGMKQEAQLSQRGRAMPCVVEYFG